MPERGPIALLFGGQSVEHDVSIRSARSVLGELERQGWDVVPVAVDLDGKWFTADNPLGVREPERAEGERLPLQLAPEPGAALLRGEGRRMEQLRPSLYLPLIHGWGGEDGTLQGLLEMAMAPYAGSGVLASALAMDKDRAKAVLQQAGVPVVPWSAVDEHAWRRDPSATVERLMACHGDALFVKPANGGSSVGISRSGDTATLAAALEHAFLFDTRAVVEKALDAREVEVSVLGNDGAEASIAGEIIPAGEFYDYTSKYQDEGTQLLIPAPVDGKQLVALQSMACETYQALGCQGFGRVDFLLERQTGAIFVSEANTLPGFTDVSMFPRLWEASGVPYDALLARIVDLGLERHARRRTLCRTPPD